MPERTPRRRRLTALLTAALAVAGTSIVQQPAEAVGGSTTTTTFGYTGATEVFTVPDGVTSLTVTLRGGQGGLGGHDSQGQPTPGGYRGLVTGTIAVTPGQELTIGVGGGGSNGTSSQGSAPGGVGGQNPLDGYDGGTGGMAGPAGSSGGGGGGGAATVIRLGEVDLVAGGAGGNGGNGQYEPIVGRRAEETHLARTDGFSTIGRIGLNTYEVCSPGFSCDGGASGAGGGGAVGGERGAVQYGGANATEYFGFGGYPGANAVGGFAGLTAMYEFYDGNGAAGSVTISYDAGTPGAPRSLTGTPNAGTGNGGTVRLTWLAPLSSGASPITDYVVRYRLVGAGEFTVFADGISTDLTALVTGLTNGADYDFEVAATNAAGTGTAAVTAVSIEPLEVVLGAVEGLAAVAGDGMIDVTWNAAPSGDGITDYRVEYATNPAGPWTTFEDGIGATPSTTVTGLANGVTYYLRVIAVAGESDRYGSGVVDATPAGVPDAPTISSVTAGSRYLRVAFTAGAGNGGSPVTAVEYRLNEGPWTAFGSTSSPQDIPGLTNGVTYSVEVRTLNAVGASAPSNAMSGTPAGLPGAVGAFVIESGADQATLSWDAADPNGSAITGYEIVQWSAASEGSIRDSWTATGTSHTLTSLTPGTYYFTIEARNAVGTGPRSAVRSSVIVGAQAPGAPTIDSVSVVDGQVTVTWTPGTPGDQPITRHLVQLVVDGQRTTVADVGAATLTATFPLPISGEVLQVRVASISLVGIGAPATAPVERPVPDPEPEPEPEPEPAPTPGPGPSPSPTPSPSPAPQRTPVPGDGEQGDADGTGNGIVTVPLPDLDVVVRFHGARPAGTAPSMEITPLTGEEDPLKDRGVTAVSTRYDITVADLEFETVEVCVPFDADVVDGQDRPEDRVRLLHTHDGVEEDITQYVDWDADPALICGTTNRFSDFQVAVYAGGRVAGADRYATAAALALRLHPSGADVVYVATGESHPDALVAGVVAAAADAPVLLVRRDRVPTATRDALAALDPERIVVVGGTNAVSTAVRSELARSAGLSAVESIAGADRYETAANAARRAGDGPSTVYVATGASFPDALTAGAIAGRTGAAVVLTAPDRLPAAAAESLRSLDPDRVVVVGGTAAISSSVESAIVDLLPDAAVERIGGADRYATAAALAEGHAGGTVVAATGTAFADALVGTTLAVAEGAPVLLVAHDRVPAVIRDRITAIDPEHLVVIGGHAAVGPQAELQLTRLLPESVPDRL